MYEARGDNFVKTFYVGIKGVIVNDGKLLLLRANKALERRDIWEMPGGRIDDDETITEALTRELKEEVPNIQNIDIHEILHAHRLHWNIDGDKSLVLIFYRVSAMFADNEPQLSNEHVDWQWADKEQALKLVEHSMHPVIYKAFSG